MLSYRDMTFCSYWENCGKAKDCHRPLTEAVKEGARKWWGDSEGGPPIAMFIDMPDCHTEFFKKSKEVKL